MSRAAAAREVGTAPDSGKNVAGLSLSIAIVNSHCHWFAFFQDYKCLLGALQNGKRPLVGGIKGRRTESTRRKT